MRIVVDLNTPGQVHFFKNFVWEMKKRGHEILVTATIKDRSIELLNNYRFNYINLGSYGDSLIKKFMNIPVKDLKMYKAVKNYKPNLFVGFGPIRSAHVSRIMKRPCIAFTDTEHSKAEHILYTPFVDAILTPSCFKKDFGKKQIRFEGYKELAYLHPNYFTPNPMVLDEIGLSKDDNIFIVRFAAFNALQDMRSEKFKKEYISPLIKRLEKEGKVIISSEIKLDKYLRKYQYRLSPEKYHDVLYYSKMYVGEGSTSAIEAAIMGVPSLHFERLNTNGKVCGITSFVGVLDELQNKYGLLYSYYNENELLVKVDEVLSDIDTIKKEWKKKREKLLEDKIDVTAFMVWLVENYPESFREMKENPEIQRRFK